MDMYRMIGAVRSTISVKRPDASIRQEGAAVELV